MNQASSDNDLLKAFLDGTLKNAELDNFIIRLQNEPAFMQAFEDISGKELTAFIKQYERNKLKQKLRAIREQYDESFNDQIYATKADGTYTTKTHNYKKSESAVVDDQKPIINEPRYNTMGRKFYLVAAVAALILIAFLTGLKLWQLNSEKSSPAIVGSDQINGEIVLPDNTNNKDTILHLENQSDQDRRTEKQIKSDLLLLRHIRQVKHNKMGFIPKSGYHDSLILNIKINNGADIYTCNNNRITFQINANSFNYFHQLTEKEFLRVTDSELIDDGLYLRLRSQYYLLMCTNNDYRLQDAVITDQKVRLVLDKLFSGN